MYKINIEQMVFKIIWFKFLKFEFFFYFFHNFWESDLCTVTKINITETFQESYGICTLPEMSETKSEVLRPRPQFLELWSHCRD